jgi:hypothetical protein
MFLDDKRDSDDVKNIQLLDVQYISILIKDGRASPKSFNQRKDLYRNSNAILALPVATQSIGMENPFGWVINISGRGDVSLKTEMLKSCRN